MAKELIEAGLDINHKAKVRVIDTRQKSTFTRLGAVCFAYQPQTKDLCFMAEQQIFACFHRISQYANLCAQTGWTPLFTAASEGYGEMAKELINDGADINAKADVRLL